MRNRLLYVSVLLCLVSFSSTGQENRVQAFLDKVAGKCVSFDYQFTTRTSVPLTGKGKAVVRDNQYFVDGNGLEIYCDGVTRWTMDRAAGEVIVEAVDAATDDILSNPAIWLTGLDRAFSVQGNVLVPKKSGGALRWIELRFQGTTLTGAVITLSDGTLADFSLNHWNFSAPTPSFILDVKALDKHFVVTDLR